MTPGWPKRNANAAEILSLGYDTARIHLFMQKDSTYYNYQLSLLPDVIADCSANGLNVILNIRNDEHDFQTIEEEWVRLINLYDGKEVIVAYELLNEPQDTEEYIYKDYIHGMVKRLRFITDKEFIVTCPPGGLKEGFDTLNPVDDVNVSYSFHFYWPHLFTHQGIDGREVGTEWPGEYHAGEKNRHHMISENIQYAVDFKNKHNVKMSVTELGCSIYADDKSAEQWLADVLGICREYDLGYCVHIYPAREDANWRLPDLINHTILPTLM